MMKKTGRLSTFLSGMLAGAMLLGCGSAALAAGGGNVTFGTMGLTSISGKTVAKAGDMVTNASGQKIPATIVYTDGAGGGNTYVPIRTVSELVDLPIDWEKDMIYLGGKSGTPTVSSGQQSPDSVSANRPKTQVGAKAGPYTEVEPYWPTEHEMTSFYDMNSRFISTSGAGGSGSADRDGGYLSLSVKNNTEHDLRLSMRCPHAVSVLWDSFPATIVPPGETVVRTFYASEYTGTLYQRELAYSLYFDGAVPPGMDTPVDATVSFVSFQK